LIRLASNIEETKVKVAGASRGGSGKKEKLESLEEGKEEEDVIFPSLTETETSLTQLKLDCLGPTERLFLDYEGQTGYFLASDQRSN
jgi:hypothetical protein